MKKRKMNLKPIWSVYTTVIFLIVLYGSLGFGKSLYKIRRLSLIKRSEERALKSAIEEKKQLEIEVERLKTDMLYIETIARERYGMLKEREEVLYITLPDISLGGEKD
ncbi:septum formation initiator family protein [Candidatus Latescibacterota bacterium]